MSPRPRAAVLLIALVVALGAACRHSPFPEPHRPVASIVSPSFKDEATRDRLGEADRVLDRLGLQPGTRVADIGAGEGYYTARVARRLGPGATLYATDVVADYLERLRARLTREGIAGVQLVLGAHRDPKLPPDSVDLAILGHVYHEIENPYEFFYRLRPALARGARVAIVDLDKPTQHHGTPPALLRCELGALGYRQVDFLPLAPAEGYLAVFEPPAELPAPEAIEPCRA